MNILYYDRSVLSPLFELIESLSVGKILMVHVGMLLEHLCVIYIMMVDSD